MSENNHIEKKFSIGKIWEKIKSLFKFKGSETVVFVKKNIVIFLFAVIFLRVYQIERYFNFEYNHDFFFFVFPIFLYTFCFVVLGKVFDRKEYMKYTILFIYLYFALSVFPNATAMFFEIRDCQGLGGVFLFPICVFFSVVIVSKAIFFLCFFACMPIFAVFFLKFKPKEVVHNRTVKKIVFIVLLLIYSLIPDIYFLASGKYEREKCAEKEYAYCFDYQPTWFSAIQLIKKGRAPFG